jgi:agmatine deiminase
MYLPAEWQEQDFVLLAYPHQDTDWNEYLQEAKGHFDNLILTIAKYQKVVLLTDNKNTLPYDIVAHKNIESLTYKCDDTWARDFGAITILGQRKQHLDFIFNGWGGKFDAKRDNGVNSALFSEYIIDSITPIEFILEGGSIESNGNGVLMTTKECLLNQNRNTNYSQKDVENILKKHLHIDKVLWLENGYLEGDDTDSHIDMLARFVSTDTIAYVKCNDEKDEHYEALSKMEKELQSFSDTNDKPFNLIALPWVDTQVYDEERLPCSYANFLIINDAVIVPQYNCHTDKIAINVLKKVFTNRDVVGVDSSLFIRQHGSIHCLSMNFYK